MAHRGLVKLEPENFTITTDQTTLGTVGINLTFPGGSLMVDWGDGSPKEIFISDAELTKNYSSTGTYDIKISGDLDQITKFIADNSRIIGITDFKTGLLTNLRLQDNLLTALDLTNVSISGQILAYSNPSLSSITFASSGNGTVTDFEMFSCNLASLDLTSVPISNTFFVYSNASLSSITFSSSGNGTVTNFRAYSCNLSSLDLSNVPIASFFWVRLNSSLSSITFSGSGNGQVTNFQAHSCDLSSLDLSNVPISTTFLAHSNSSLSSIIFSSSGNGTISDFEVFSCNLSSLDLSNVSIAGFFWVYSNSSLSSMTFSGSGNGVLIDFRAFSCSLPNIDFSVFPTSDGVSIRVQNNSFAAIEHDDQIINLDATGWINGILNILTGNTARTPASDTAFNNMIANGWTIS